MPAFGICVLICLALVDLFVLLVLWFLYLLSAVILVCLLLNVCFVLFLVSWFVVCDFGCLHTSFVCVRFFGSILVVVLVLCVCCVSDCVVLFAGLYVGVVGCWILRRFLV